MLGPTNEVYPKPTKWGIVVFDLRDPEATRAAHDLRAEFRERTDIVGLDADHVLVVVRPARAQEMS